MAGPPGFPAFGLMIHPTGSGGRFGVPAAAAPTPVREATGHDPQRSADPRIALRLGLDCSLHWGHARRLVGDFRRRNPDVDLTISDTDEANGPRRLQRDELDAAIVVHSQTPNGLMGEQLWSERLIAALPESHALAQVNAVEPAEIRDEVVLIAGEDAAHQGLRRAIVRALGGPPAAFLRQPVERDTLFDLVALDFGVTVVPGATTGAFYPGVSFRPIASRTADVAYALYWRPDNRNPALHQLVRLARSLTSRGDRPLASGNESR